MPDYYLDTPMNIAGIPYTKAELQAIILTRVPCESFIIIARNQADSSQIGCGVYIKKADAGCFIEVVDEQGVCQGLMTSLFGDRPVRFAPRAVVPAQ